MKQRKWAALAGVTIGTLGGVAVMQGPPFVQWIALELAVMVAAGSASLLCLRAMDKNGRPW